MGHPYDARTQSYGVTSSLGESKKNLFHNIEVKVDFYTWLFLFIYIFVIKLQAVKGIADTP